MLKLIQFWTNEWFFMNFYGRIISLHLGLGKNLEWKLSLRIDRVETCFDLFLGKRGEIAFLWLFMLFIFWAILLPHVNNLRSWMVELTIEDPKVPRSNPIPAEVFFFYFSLLLLWRPRRSCGINRKLPKLRSLFKMDRLCYVDFPLKAENPHSITYSF